jgi:Tfp pilus assembly protein FimT
MASACGVPETGGFTLMELIVVTCLLSLFLVFSIPRLESALPADPLNATVRRMIATVSELKIIAVRNSRAYRLHLDMDQRLVWISHEAMTADELLAARKTGFRLPAAVRILGVEFADAGKASSGSAEIAFSSRGYSSKALIHLQGRGGAPVSLLIESFLPGAAYSGRRMTFEAGQAG